ncbi:GntR family transcriptional regulator [Breoghania sp.]|uniref:GntR family transcriptional regulator n=1 Tax=Breoghania sp. TaxID=2065378 RepID=UPI002634A102|nr:GntR family transcriptional regulator [Breoghania sp.]
MSLHTGAKDIWRILREQIVSRAYLPNEPIPSSRALALELDVSRTTVSAAYEQLVAEGYIEVRQGRRPRVAASLAIRWRQKPSAPRNEKGEIHLPEFGKRLISSGPVALPTMRGVRINFRYGEMASRDFPIAAWKKAVQSQRALSDCARLSRVISGAPASSIATSSGSLS